MNRTVQRPPTRNDFNALAARLKILEDALENPTEMNAHGRRWQEVGRCFRERQGVVTVTEADKYLQKTHGYCAKLVLAGCVPATYTTSKGGLRRMYVNAGAIMDAVHMRMP